MIQRQQTLWLLLAAVAALLTFMFPFVTGQVMEKEGLVLKSIDAGSNFLLLFLTGISIALAGSTIFLYKNRKLQMKLCVLGMVLSVGIIVLYVLQLNKLTQSTLALYCILPLLALIGYIFAWRNINKDEKLVRSLDKIR